MSITISNFINNEFVPVTATDTEQITLVNPATGETIGTYASSSNSDVDAAFAAAKTAFTSWSKQSPGARSAALLKFADRLEELSAEIVAAQHENTGQPKPLIASEEVTVGCDQIRFFAGAARLLSGLAQGEYMEGMTSSIRREPIGVVAQVTPWNYPFMMAVWKVAPALAAGCTVVLKPAPSTPGSTMVFAQAAAETLPPGVFNVVVGGNAVGEALTHHPVPAQVSITGSVRAGIAVATAAAQDLKRAHLELGGKAPVIVYADADLDQAAEHIATTGFFNAGQDCTAACRVIVEESVAAEFTAKLVAAAQAVNVGSGDDCLYGPVNNSSQFERILGILNNLPAHITIATGGKALAQPGFFIEPTVLVGCRQDDQVIQEEIFGPVITVQTFTDTDDALAKANGVNYALASSVWSSNHQTVERVARELDFGCVWINTHIPLVAEMPHGGFKHSGYGKDLSLYGLEDYTRIKHVMSAH